MRGRFHVHLRKRHARGLEPYPARSFALRVLDSVVFVAGIVGPLMTLPQIFLIYSTHEAAGVSPISWGAFAMLDIPWIIYGIMHREPPIIVTYSLWLVFNGLVCAGALIY